MPKKKILIIDDEEQFTQMVKLNLEGTGRYYVFVENNAFNGYKITKVVMPDLILLDIIMPEMPTPPRSRSPRVSTFSAPSSGSRSPLESA